MIDTAFNSLSFRGKRMWNYPRNTITRSNSKLKPKTYGAILCIKNNSYKDVYALVQGRYTGKWSFPKGHSNEGENPMECMRREVAEETGIVSLPEPIEYIQIGYGSYFVFNLPNRLILNPRDTHEIMNTKWVTLDEMEKMVLNADASIYRRKLKSKICHISF